MDTPSSLSSEEGVFCLVSPPTLSFSGHRDGVLHLFPPGKFQLTPRFIEHDGGGIRQVETAAIRGHGNA